MLAMLLDALHISAVDLVANDSGGAVAQLFLAKYPRRVRTLLLTSCDVDEKTARRLSSCRSSSWRRKAPLWTSSSSRS